MKLGRINADHHENAGIKVHAEVRIINAVEQSIKFVGGGIDPVGPDPIDHQLNMSRRAVISGLFDHTDRPVPHGLARQPFRITSRVKNHGSAAHSRGQIDSPLEVERFTVRIEKGTWSDRHWSPLLRSADRTSRPFDTANGVWWRQMITGRLTVRLSQRRRCPNSRSSQSAPDSRGPTSVNDRYS